MIGDNVRHYLVRVYNEPGIVLRAFCRVSQQILITSLGRHAYSHLVDEEAVAQRG